MTQSIRVETNSVLDLLTIARHNAPRPLLLVPTSTLIRVLNHLEHTPPINPNTIACAHIIRELFLRTTTTYLSNPTVPDHRPAQSIRHARMRSNARIRANIAPIEEKIAHILS